MQPAHDPWQQISQQISQAGSTERPGRRPGPWHDGAHQLARDKFNFGAFAGRTWLALAASVMLVAVSSVFVMQSAELQTPASQPVANVDDPLPAMAESTIAYRPTTSLEREYQAAFREFVRLDLSEASVSANTRAAMLQDWELMQKLEQDLLVALEQEPENSLLLDRWMQLRASQLQLLHVIAETGQLPGRTLI
jgi:hypothetical protein